MLACHDDGIHAKWMTGVRVLLVVREVAAGDIEAICGLAGRRC
jgi:hypothetical protein